MNEKAVGLAFGTLFGIWLSWVGFTQYDVIMDALLLRDWYLWATFFSAVATGFVCLRILRAAKTKTIVGGADIAWPTQKLSRDHVVGSVIFGIGWGIAGTCPGPVVAQLGRGQWAGIFTGAGIFIGILLRERLDARLGIRRERTCG